MWRMIRAALIGIVLGVVGGAIVGQVYYIRYLYRMMQQEKNEAMNALVYSNDSVLYEDAFGGAFEVGDSYSELFGEIEAFDTEYLFTEGQNKQERVSLPEIIQLNVIYSGNEGLTTNEMAELQVFVKQAVLYALAEKLGEDYSQTMTKAEMQKSLIMSLEYINEAAKESAKEWGISVDSRSKFDLQYMQEDEINGILCPAGYYEVLNIYLAE